MEYQKIAHWIDYGSNQPSKLLDLCYCYTSKLILYLNKMLFTFAKIETPLCSFCHSYDETIKHIFLECIYIKQLWNHLRLLLTNDISLPILTPQTAIFGFINGIESSVYKIKNHILLIFKLHVYKSRERGTLELSRLITEIKKLKLFILNHLKFYFFSYFKFKFFFIPVVGDVQKNCYYIM